MPRSAHRYVIACTLAPNNFFSANSSLQPIELRFLPTFDHRASAGIKNASIHQALVELSGSQIILETIKNIFMHVRAIRRMTIAQSDRASRSIEDHMRIIEALEARDTERVETLVRQHSFDLALYVEAHCDFLD